MILRLVLSILMALQVNAQNLGTKVETIDQSPDMPARSMYIELNPTEGATGFEVHIRPFEQFWATPYIFKVPVDQPNVRVRLTPGRYAIRTRSLDQYGFPGPWGKWGDFWVYFKSPDNVFPADGAQIQPKAVSAEKVTFEWPHVQTAKGYLVVVRNEKGEILRAARTVQPWIIIDLELNSKYSWGVIPLTKNSDFNEHNLKQGMKLMKFNNFSVLGPALGTKDVTFAVNRNEKVAKYQFEFLKLTSKGEPGAASIYESYAPDYRVGLTPGAYEVRVRMHFVDGSISDWSPPSRFYIPYPQPRGKVPKEKGIVDSTDDENSKVHLEWEAKADAGYYMVYIYGEDGKVLHGIRTEETSLDLTLPHNLKYKWIVVPHGPGEIAKTPPSPETAQEFEINKYIPLLLSTPEEPSHIYGWGRYWASSASYVGRNYDLNSLVRQPIYGGTGELALGYWHRKTNIGLLAHGGLSGFVLGNSVYNWAYGGLHLGYRRILPGGARVRYWLGASYMEFPEIIRDAFIKDFSFHRVKNMGPQFQVSYMDEFKSNPKYGWHTYGLLYYSTEDIQTPNNLPQKPELSYTLGIFGTYQYSRDQKWMLGYSYRREFIRYETTDPSGKDNTSDFSEHFLNLSIEFGLSKEHYK